LDAAPPAPGPEQPALFAEPLRHQDLPQAFPADTTPPETKLPECNLPENKLPENPPTEEIDGIPTPELPGSNWPEGPPQPSDLPQANLETTGETPITVSPVVWPSALEPLDKLPMGANERESELALPPLTVQPTESQAEAPSLPDFALLEAGPDLVPLSTEPPQPQELPEVSPVANALPENTLSENYPLESTRLENTPQNEPQIMHKGQNPTFDKIVAEVAKIVFGDDSISELNLRLVRLALESAKIHELVGTPTATPQP
jgi:hypothetical protein